MSPVQELCVRLKASEVKQFRLDLLSKQEQCCRLCKLPLEQDEAVLDHDHKTGIVRGTIHRGCNTALGKLENAARRYNVPLFAFAMNLAGYLDEDQGVLHPTFRTSIEKKELAKKRRIRRIKVQKRAK